MEDRRRPKLIGNYKPIGKRDVGRPVRRWEDSGII